jgi:hypothetical protein
MQRFPSAHHGGSSGGFPPESRARDLEALLEENRRLRGLVVYLSRLVIKNVAETVHGSSRLRRPKSTGLRIHSSTRSEAERASCAPTSGVAETTTIGVWR